MNIIKMKIKFKIDFNSLPVSLFCTLDPDRSGKTSNLLGKVCNSSNVSPFTTIVKKGRPQNKSVLFCFVLNLFTEGVQ